MIHFLLKMSISINVNFSMHFCLCMCNSNKLCSFEIWEKFTFMKSTFWKTNIEKFYLVENCDMTQLEKGHFHQKIHLKMMFLPYQTYCFLLSPGFTLPNTFCFLAGELEVAIEWSLTTIRTFSHTRNFIFFLVIVRMHSWWTICSKN